MYRYNPCRFDLCLLLIAMSLLLACDPGFSYRPRGWERSGNEWEKQFEDIELATDGIQGFLATDSITPYFNVKNYTSSSIVLERADLVSGETTYPADLPSHGEVVWRTVSPGLGKNITLFWTFDKPAMDVLNSRPRIVLHFSQEGRRRKIDVYYDKD